MAPDQDYFFVCECPKEARSSCCREIFYKEHDGKRYCVLHYPDVNKARDFEQAMLRKYYSRDYDFRAAYFPAHISFYQGEFFEDADFSDAIFNGQVNFWNNTFHKKAQFSRAAFTCYTTFKGAKFLGEAEFGKATFNDTTYFEEAQFAKEASFMKTTFNAFAYFAEAVFQDKVHFLWTKFTTNSYFNLTQFCDIAQFSGTQFGGDARFGGSVFKANVYLNGIEFKERAVFTNVTFCAVAKFNGSLFTSDANFSKAFFKEDSFGTFINSIFEDRLRFAETTFENRSALNFTLATFQKPERVYFSRVQLHPYWFLYIDPRKFTFTKVKWCNVRSYRTIRREVEELTNRGAEDPYHLLAITCRQLATNAEENDRYGEAADLRFLGMELQRRETWQNLKSNPWEWNSWKNIGVLRWLYGLASGYGERVGQAAAVLLSLLLVFAFVYYFWQRDGQWWKPSQNSQITNSTRPIPSSDTARLGLRDCVIYSAYVMALQKPEPLPANRRAKTIVFIETILGPLQATLLVLAIRRKFMQ